MWFNYLKIAVKLDFEPKVSATIRRYFRQTINNTIKSHLLPVAEQQADEILQQYNHARAYLEQTLEQEAEGKIASNRRLQSALEQKIKDYDSAVAGINNCLRAMQLHKHLLPTILQSDFIPVSPKAEAFDISSNGNGVADSEAIADAVKHSL